MVFYGDLTTKYGDFMVIYGDLTTKYGDFMVIYGDLSTKYGDLWWFNHQIWCLDGLTTKHMGTLLSLPGTGPVPIVSDWIKIWAKL